jgi:hypothetical protein
MQEEKMGSAGRRKMAYMLIRFLSTAVRRSADGVQWWIAVMRSGEDAKDVEESSSVHGTVSDRIPARAGLSPCDLDSGMLLLRRAVTNGLGYGEAEVPRQACKRGYRKRSINREKLGTDMSTNSKKTDM